MTGEGEGEEGSFLFSPPPTPSTLFFCFRSNFRAITRLETLATQATDTQDYIPCLGQRGQKPYPVQRHIPVLYRLFKGVLINLGEEPSKRFSEAAGSVFWVSLPGLPGDTGSNYCERGTQLTK